MYMYVCMYACVYMYVCMHVYTCMYVCSKVHIYFNLPIEIICHYPPEIENGNVTFTSTNFNSIATYTCNERFSLSTNNDILTCQEEGVWIGELPACIGKCLYVRT